MVDKQISIKVTKSGGEIKESGLLDSFKKIAGGLGGGKGGGIGAALSSAAGGAGGIAKAGASLGSIAAEVGVIAGLMAVVAGAVTALVASSQFLQRTLGRFVQMFMLLVRPIADIFATLLQPLIWMLMPLVRVMSMIFRPFQQFLRQALGSRREQFMENMNNPAGIFGLYMAAIAEAMVNYIGMLFENFKLPGLGDLGSVDLVGIVKNLLMPEGGIVEFTWNWLFDDVKKKLGLPEDVKFSDWVTEHVFDEIKKMLGLNKEDTLDINTLWGSIVTYVSGFFGFEEDDTTVDKLYKVVVKSVVAFFAFTTPLDEEQVKTLFRGVRDAVVNFFEFEKGDTTADILYKVLKKAVVSLLTVWLPVDEETVKGWWKALTGVVQWISEIKWEEWKDMVWTAWNNVVSGVLGLLDYVAGLFDWLPGQQKPPSPNEKGKFQCGQDFVVTPSGQMIRTDPMDYLFAVKNPQNLVGGGVGGVSFDFSGMTIYASDAEEVKRKLDELIQEQMSKLA